MFVPSRDKIGQCQDLIEGIDIRKFMFLLLVFRYFTRNVIKTRTHCTRGFDFATKLHVRVSYYRNQATWRP